MIRKIDLVDAINDLSHDLLALSLRVSDLERKVKTCNKKTKGQLTKKEEDKLEKAIRAVSQPRTKDGKFAKKKQVFYRGEELSPG